MKAKTFVLLSLPWVLALPLRAGGGQYAPRSGPGATAPAPVPVDDPSGLGLSYVSYLTGETLFSSGDTEGWAALAPNLSLRTGDRLWAGEGGRIEVRFPDGSTAWLNDRSELDLVRLERSGQGDVLQLALVSGEGSFDVKGVGVPGSVFQVDLPSASLRAYGASHFRVNALPDGTAQVGVVEGSVDLEIPDGVATVRAGQLAEIRPDRRVALDFLPAPDDWDDWVQARADLYDRPAPSARYLPPDLASYAHEFDNSGSWVAYPPFGSVWVPAVEPGWSPYSYGRWVWEAGDYVWLPYDPWYAPFHYGRWEHGTSIGWFWIAPRQAHWSPGYVAWSLTDDAVCWVPLGHGEVYYGYGDRGRRNGEVRRDTRAKASTVYVNSRVANGVVVVRRASFLGGRIERERITESRNPFLHSGQGGFRVIRRPPVDELRPIRETRHPRPETEGDRAVRPPERVDRESHAIRERPVIRDRERSVFIPRAAPAPLRTIEKEPGVDQAEPPRRRPMGFPSVAPAPSPERRRGQPPEQPMQRSREGIPPAAGQPATPAPRGRPAESPVAVPAAPPERPRGQPPEQPMQRPVEGRPPAAIPVPRERPRQEGPETVRQPGPPPGGATDAQGPVGKRPYRRVREAPTGQEGAVPAEVPKASPETQQKRRLPEEQPSEEQQPPKAPREQRR